MFESVHDRQMTLYARTDYTDRQQTSAMESGKLKI